MMPRSDRQKFLKHKDDGSFELLVLLRAASEQEMAELNTWIGTYVKEDTWDQSFRFRSRSYASFDQCFKSLPKLTPIANGYYVLFMESTPHPPRFWRDWFSRLIYELTRNFFVESKIVKDFAEVDWLSNEPEQ